MLKCINDFSKMRDADLVNKALNVQSSMTGNALFPDPPVKMEVLATDAQDYSDALVEAKSRDKVKVAQKNKVRKSLIKILSQLLAYVNVKSDGDKPTLLSSGFTLGKETANVYELGEFGALKLALGKNSGEVNVSYAKVDGAVSYMIDYAESPVLEDAWKSEPNSYLKHVLKGLARGKEYAIRVRASGRGSIQTYSPTMTILVV